MINQTQMLRRKILGFALASVLCWLGGVGSVICCSGIAPISTCCAQDRKDCSATLVHCWANGRASNETASTEGAVSLSSDSGPCCLWLNRSGNAVRSFSLAISTAQPTPTAPCLSAATLPVLSVGPIESLPADRGGTYLRKCAFLV